MISGPSGKRKSEPLSPTRHSSVKRQTTDAPTQPAGATSPQGAHHVVPALVPEHLSTQPALRMPEVTNSYKRRYPQAPPYDFDTRKELSFLNANAKNLTAKLKAANMIRGHLLSTKGRSVLTKLGVAQRGFVAARDELSKELDGTPFASKIDSALEDILPPLRTHADATSRRWETDAKWVQARQSGHENEITFAKQDADEALADLNEAQAALDKAIPNWARSGTAKASFLGAAENKVSIVKETQQLVKSMRVTWLELGGEAFTKLPHFACGAFGKVALAMRRDQSMLALKVLRTTPSKKNDSTQMTEENDAKREVALMQRYYDPSVRLHRDPHSNKLIVEMPLAAGSLDTFRESRETLVRSTGRQVFARLAEMHADHVVHNDLKPENINVHSDGRVLLADFGLAGFLPEGVAVGTPAYAAPEQCPGHQGPPAGASTDVWAAGLSLATAHVPLQGSPFAITEIKEMQKVHGDFESWRSALLAGPDRSLLQRLTHEPSNPFSAYFTTLHHMDSTLCSYLLTKVLVPLEERVSAAEARDFFAGLQPENCEQEDRLAEHLAGREKTPYRLAARLALQERFAIEDKVAQATAGKIA